MTDRLWTQVFRGTADEAIAYIRGRGWDRLTKVAGVPGWEIKRDGISKTDDGNQAYLVLTDREEG